MGEMGEYVSTQTLVRGQWGKKGKGTACRRWEWVRVRRERGVGKGMGVGEGVVGDGSG